MRSLPLQFVHRTIGVAALSVVAAAPCGAQRSAPTATVVGRAVDSLSQPIMGADVGIAALHLSTTTD
ncbi:MAG TPA: hypothetical protein VF737_06980, partial [Gemmatimonadaceae bacterium]